MAYGKNESSVVPVPGSSDITTPEGFASFIRNIGGVGSEIYNATQSGNNAQQVANTSDPFRSQRPYYQEYLHNTFGNQQNPYGTLFQQAYAGQNNPYEAQYQSARANQTDPYAAMIMQQLGPGGQSNPYETQLQGLLHDPNSFRQDPGYQFALGQGQQAVNRSSNALYGGARTGALSAELAKYTTGYANQAYGQRIDQLSNLTNAQNTFNTNRLNSLGSLSGQQQTTNTNQLNQLAGLIGGQNTLNSNNLNALGSMYNTQGNINNQQIGHLLTASGANQGNPGAAGQAIQSGQQGTAASIGAAIAAIPALAPYAAQIAQWIARNSGGGGNGALTPGGLYQNENFEPGGNTGGYGNPSGGGGVVPPEPEPGYGYGPGDTPNIDDPFWP